MFLILLFPRVDRFVPIDHILKTDPAFLLHILFRSRLQMNLKTHGFIEFHSLAQPGLVICELPLPALFFKLLFSFFDSTTSIEKIIQIFTNCWSLYLFLTGLPNFNCTYLQLRNFGGFIQYWICEDISCTLCEMKCHENHTFG